MAVVNLFFNRPSPTQIIRTIAGSDIPLTLDATVKETFSAKGELTKHPVEKKKDIADHVIIRPASLSISAFITQTPFEGVLGLVKAAGATVASTIGAGLGVFGSSIPGAALGGAAGAVVGGSLTNSLASVLFGSSQRPLGSISAEFVKIRDSKQPITIVTGLQKYEDYILTSFSCSRDKGTGGGLQVELEFEETLFADSATSQVAIPSIPSALQKLNKGRQTEGDLSGDQSGKGSSLLKKIF